MAQGAPKGKGSGRRGAAMSNGSDPAPRSSEVDDARCQARGVACASRICGASSRRFNPTCRPTESPMLRTHPLRWLALAAAAVSLSASANTITQNTSWKVTRSGATQTDRVVAYGDSIFAGYYGQLFSVARRAAPYTDGEYLSSKWNANIEVVRRTKSGAKADDIYNNKS